MAAVCLLWGAAALAVTVSAPASSVDPEWDLFGFSAVDHPPTARVSKPWQEMPFPYLPDEPNGRSVSIGTVTDGHIVNALALPLPGRTYGILPRQYQRRLTYGSEELIEGIVAASEYVEQVHPGAVLWLGNIGRRGGGDIPWSVSHNAGRDADLAFYTLDPDGNEVMPPDLLHYRGNGRSREYGGYYRFDDARNWALVKALVLSETMQIQYLFISNPLRERLLDHARSVREPGWLVDRAGLLLRQPGPEIPHDDHLHIRAFCSRFDVTGGCQNIGRIHSGTETYTAELRGRVAHAVSLLRAGEAETRRLAVERLRVLEARSELDMVRRRLSDPSPLVRAAAVDTIAALGSERSVDWLVLHWEDETEDYVRERLVRAAGRLGGRSAGLFLTDLLSAPRWVEVEGRRYDLRLVALDAVRQSGRAEPAWALIDLLAVEDTELRARAALTLRYLSNRQLDHVDWRQDVAESEVVAAEGAWRAWLQSASRQSRDEWVAEGFGLVGVPMRGGARQAAAEIARVINDERTWLSDNAQRQLMRMTGNEPRSLDWPRSDAEMYWVRWVRRNPGRVRWQ